MTMLVSYQAVPLTFYNKIAPMRVGKPIAYTFRWKNKVTEWKGGTVGTEVVGYCRGPY